MTRPVLIVGPLADAVLDKLVSDYPHKYARCEPRYTNWSQEDLEREAMENCLIDFKYAFFGLIHFFRSLEKKCAFFRRRGSHYECTTVQAIKEVCERVRGC